MSEAVKREDRVTATVNYVRNPPAPGEPALYYNTEDESASTMVVAPGYEVSIINGRPQRESFTLDCQGFALVEHDSSIGDMDAIEDDEAMADVYRAEIRDLMFRITGAAEIIVQPGIKKRYGESAVDKIAALMNAKPARYVHADNSDEASEIVLKNFAAQVPEIRLSDFSRYSIYNVWRCISPAPQDIPLAVCDARSLAPDDPVVATALTIDRTYGDIRHDTLGFRYRLDHKWYYFRDMTPGEVIVFKQHDSDPSRPCRVPHTAFDDPSCPAVAITRCSVEIRVIALFR